MLFRFEKEFRSLDPHFDTKLEGASVQKYLCNFVWNDSRFSTKAHTAQSLLAKFKEEISTLDSLIKKCTSEHNAARQFVDGLSRKSSGNLQSRSLAELVSKEDVIPPSEYLVAVFVVVSSGDSKKFEESYDTLTNFVVPDSQKKICTEGDFILYRVVLFKNVLKEYIDKARDLKWLLREYEHHDGRRADDKKDFKAAETAATDARATVLRHLMTAYPDALIIIAHLKTLRVFCESILRFGRPEVSQFCSAVLLVKRGKYEDLRRTLNDLYKHLADDAFVASEEELVANVDVHPYVCFPFNVHGPEFRDL